MITLYHGTTLCLEHPLANAGREDLDFGRGFYLARLREQAERWALRMQLIRMQPSTWVNIYDFDMDSAIKAGYKMLYFEAYDKQWLDFIIASRNGEKPWLEYDMVEGGVANDKVIDVVEDYLNSYITVEQALGQLKYAKPNNQICLLNQSLIDNYLHYKDGYSVHSQTTLEGGTL